MIDHEASAKLRARFPSEVIGKLPKAGIELDYVGHAAVTDRLLEVDPAWTWEPAGVTDHGLPMFDGSGGLWIRLTVAGVTRYGYGDGASPKECIGDAIRNAAMRFGVALELWSKSELESSGAARSQAPDTTPTRPAVVERSSSAEQRTEPSDPAGTPAVGVGVASLALAALIAKAGSRSKAREAINRTCDMEYTARTLWRATDEECELALAALEEEGVGS